MANTDRINREKRVARFMIGYYCRRRHGRAGESGLCGECAALADYADARLSACRFGESKASCGRCRVHCYSPRRRAQIKDVMRFVGPRMLFLMPLEYLRHRKD
jgi:hypothetical protein